jgi:DNA polymerase zeta
MPASSESEQEIDTSDTAVKSPQTHDVDNIDPSIGRLLIQPGERIEAVTKAWLDNDELRPMKKLRIASEKNTQVLAPRLGLFSSTFVKDEVVFGAQGPSVFSAQAKKDIKNAYIYAIAPPSVSELLSGLESHDLPNRVYQDPHYSKAEDVPERPWEFAGLVYRLKKGDGLSVLEEWGPSSAAESLTESTSAEDRNIFEDRFDRTGVGGWEYASTPPSLREVRRWLNSTTGTQLREKQQARSQASGYDCPHEGDSAHPLCRLMA